MKMVLKSENVGRAEAKWSQHRIITAYTLGLQAGGIGNRTPFLPRALV